MPERVSGEKNVSFDFDVVHIVRNQNLYEKTQKHDYQRLKSYLSRLRHETAGSPTQISLSRLPLGNKSEKEMFVI